MISYEIFLPNEKARTIGYVTLFILLINGLVFSFLAFSSHIEKIKTLAIAGAVISLVSLLLYFTKLIKGRFAAYLPEVSFFIFSVLWLLMGKWLLALFIICFAGVGYYARKQFKVVFTKEQVIYPAFPPKTYRWDELSNVVLKDNVLTVDLKNNKLIQVVVAKESADEIDEQGFNEFCRMQLK